MNQELHDEEVIVRYLLGDLPEEEEIRIEDRAFSDRQLMQNILAVESDLIDEYVRGKLPRDKRGQFEKRFFASEERRRKVEFARVLAAVAHETATAKAAAPETAAEETPVVQTARTQTGYRGPARTVTASWMVRFVEFMRTANPAARFAIAAVVGVFVVGVSWLIVQTINLRRDIQQLQAEQRALDDAAAAERARGEELAAQLQTEREQRAQSEELVRQLEQERVDRSGSSAQQSGPREQSSLASLFLFPGVSRGAGNRPKLTLPSTARLVRLDIGLSPEDDYQSFQIDVMMGLQRVWAQPRLRSRQSTAGKVLSVTVPASRLQPGEYEVSLKGLVDDGRTEDLRYYHFTVVGK